MERRTSWLKIWGKKKDFLSLTFRQSAFNVTVNKSFQTLMKSKVLSKKMYESKI